MLPLHFTSAEAKAEARRLQTDSRETMAHEPVMEVVETWLNTHLSQQQIETPGNEDFDDDDPGDALYVRSLITTTMIREELASNPIIRDLRGTACLVSLSNCGDVEKSLRHGLRVSARRMIGVSPIRLSADIFHRVQLSRNTSQYSFLMRICELVYHSLLPDEQDSSSKFQNILEDEVRMSALFEDFLRNFYKSELPGFTAASEIMPWLADAESEADLAYLPIMKTDITLRSGERTIVADAKYYREALAGGRYSSKVRSAHLYQLSTYLSHTRAREPRQEVSGLLIYPAVGQNLRLRYQLMGTPVLVATVDLSAEWPEIHEELVELISPQMSCREQSTFEHQ